MKHVTCRREPSLKQGTTIKHIGVALAVKVVLLLRMPRSEFNRTFWPDFWTQFVRGACKMCKLETNSLYLWSIPRKPGFASFSHSTARKLKLISYI